MYSTAGFPTSPRIEKNGRASIERPENHLFEPVKKNFAKIPKPEKHDSRCTRVEDDDHR
jgi:hypothetical protein